MITVAIIEIRVDLNLVLVVLVLKLEELRVLLVDTLRELLWKLLCLGLCRELEDCLCGLSIVKGAPESFFEPAGAAIPTLRLHLRGMILMLCRL